MGNRIQHALRAFTPRDQKAVKAAAETFAPNPKVNVVEAITQLGVGEALVSTLQEGGIPMPVERAWIVSPGCRIGTITPEERAAVRARSPVGGKYDTTVDRESAFETLNQRAQQATPPPAPGAPSSGKDAQQAQGGGWTGMAKDMIFGTSRRQGMLETMAKSVVRNAGGQLGRSILRGVLGSMSKR
jgi:DNA helicase HerA-like ATPase